jgi:hypothetical protein
MAGPDLVAAAGTGARQPRVDLSVLGPWHVDAAYLDPAPASPARAWLRMIEAEYGLLSDDLGRVLQELGVGWSIRTSFERAAVPVTAWNTYVDVLHRLALAGVLLRSALQPPTARKPQREETT